ncbi:MAG: NUDIX domain-containing protein [Candidatus Cloacimonadota bacterium]|nr:MAG: NUDIX domain-containing protein [Candidatus Cloacimonadota bacterium]
MKFEFSAGGIVCKGEKVLLIKTEDLKGNPVWTFPKGIIEKGEKAKDAALREVREETGYDVKIVRLFDVVEYFFRREGELIKKSVKWFLMEPIKRMEEPDWEVSEITWIKYDEAKELLTYKSDRKLIQLIIEASE